MLGIAMTSINHSVFEFIHQFAGQNFILDDIGIFIAKYLAYGMTAAFLVLAYYESDWRKRLYVFSEGAIAIMLARGLFTPHLRFFYHHLRPFVVYGFTPLVAEDGFSFPSGHAAWFFALALTVWYVNRRWGVWFFALSALMGIARIYAGVHWPLDIFGGVLVGLFAAYLTRCLLERARKQLYQH